MKRIALVVPYYDAPFYAGIGRYIALRRNWRVSRFAWFDSMPRSLDPFPFDGIIVQLFKQTLFDDIQKTGRPAVNVSDFRTDWPIPHVFSDNRAIGQMGAQHLLERGFKRLAFAASRGNIWSDLREEGFCQVVGKAGLPCSTLVMDGRGAPVMSQRRDSFVEWLRQQIKPFGVMAANDATARILLEIALDSGIKVPEDMAIVGVDNSVIACDLVELPISSIEPDFARIAFEAATMLDRQMQGEKLSNEPVLIPPMGVNIRQSTDVMAIEDPEVSQALSFIRINLADVNILDHLVEEVARSRRWVERRFRKVLGRSLMEEVMRARLSRAQQLLRETDLPMPEVASFSGFTDLNHLGRSFKRELSMTPTAYRKAFRFT